MNLPTEYMGLILFFWIVGGSLVGAFIASSAR